MFTIPQLQPRARRSSTIAAALRQLISSGQLKPGDKLPTESELCQQFVVSRTTLREAIQMLRTSGLLDVTPGRGSYIRMPDIQQLLSDMALASQCQQHHIHHINNSIFTLHRESLSNIAKVSNGKHPERFRNLSNYTLNHHSIPEQNSQLEAQWHLQLTQCAGNPVHHMLMQALLAMQSNHRFQRYHNPDEVMRTLQIQLRVNSALAEADYALAERVIGQYLSSTSGQQQAHAA